MQNRLFHYVIKNEEGTPTGYPVTIENLLQVLNLAADTKVNKSLLLDSGYFPFTLVQRPADTTRQQVQDNGLVLSSDGYARSDYVMVDKALADINMSNILNEKLSTLKLRFEAASKRPKVDTGLGFFVDGSHDDLQNFKLGQDLMLPYVMDSEGVRQAVNTADYVDIILAIQEDKLALMNVNWDTKALLHGVDLQSMTALVDIDAIVLPFQINAVTLNTLM